MSKELPRHTAELTGNVLPATVLKMIFSGYKIKLPLIIAAILTLACAWLVPAAVTEIEAKVDDHIWQIIGSQHELEQRIVVIDIDEQSVARYGAWPWPREMVAELASKARQNNVNMLIFDIVFPAEKEGDKHLAEELKQVPSVLAQILAVNASAATQMGVLKPSSADRGCETAYPKANTIIANTSLLVSAASSAGHITPNIDADGVIRSIPSIICYSKKPYPALALASVAEGYGQQSSFQLVENNEWWKSSYSLGAKGLSAELSVPVTKHGNIVLPWWLSRNSIISISAIDLLEGTVPSNLLQGKWAIIGSTAFGAGDSVVTPQGAVVDGVEVHVQLISALLDNRIPFVPRIASILVLVLILIIAILLSLSTRVKGYKVVYMPLLIALLLSCAVLAVHALMLRSEYMLIPWLYAAIFSMMSGFLMALSGYAASRRESDRLYQNLSSYLPAHAAKWIAAQQPVDVLDARHEKVLVLHADLRNFSIWCNHLPAKQAGAVLHAFYTITGDIIQRMGGDVEEYAGGAVTAIWRGAQADRRALLAANEIISQSETLLGSETKRDDTPPLAVGVGIEYGDILAGSFGSSQRRTYTVIGKTITIAMRLQGLTADIGVPILIGEAAAECWLEAGATKEGELDSLGDFLLQDTNKPITVYAPAELSNSH